MAGAGGQGILFLGKVLAQAGMIEGKQVTFFPSYGAEMRGGTTNCTVILSDDMIGSPVVLNPDILITMNRASLERFQPQLKKKGLLFFDSSLISGVTFRDNIVAVGIPATLIAGAGDTRTANMVMLGALIAKTGLLKKSTLDKIFASSPASAKDEASGINKDEASGINKEFISKITSLSFPDSIGESRKGLDARLRPAGMTNKAIACMLANKLISNRKSILEGIKYFENKKSCYC